MYGHLCHLQLYQLNNCFFFPSFPLRNNTVCFTTMNPSEFPQQNIEAITPPLRVGKESHTIRKQPLPSTTHHNQPAGASQHRQPLIIFYVSPKFLHVLVTDFMMLINDSPDLLPEKKLLNYPVQFLCRLDLCQWKERVLRREKGIEIKRM